MLMRTSHCLLSCVQPEARALLEDAFKANTLPTGPGLSKAKIQIRTAKYQELGQQIGRPTDVSCKPLLSPTNWAPGSPQDGSPMQA